MSAQLLGDDAPDVEDFLCSWMSPLMRTATERKTDDEMPFCQVARISGADDADLGADEAVVQLDIFDRARAGMLAAQNAAISARNVHRRMTLMAREQSNVTLSDGSIACPDMVTTILRPFRMAYGDDQIVRYVARYTVGLSYVAV